MFDTQKLDYLEKQILQYQGTNPFGAGMTRVFESTISTDRWDKETVMNVTAQVAGSWVYWATIKLEFPESPDLRPPYMIMTEAEINGRDISSYPWLGEVSSGYTGQLAYCGVEAPYYSWIPELHTNDVEFFTVAASNFPTPPSLKYKIKVYSPYRASIQILYEKKYGE